MVAGRPAMHDKRLILSLRTSNPKHFRRRRSCAAWSASIGEGGGHRTKAGGFIALENGTPPKSNASATVLRADCFAH